MKHLDPNDPRFTAKALGEQEPQSINPEAVEEFEAIQSFASTLKSELNAQDEKDALTEEQKERVRKAIEPQQQKVLKFPMWINAVAACMVLGLVGIASFKVLEKSNTPEFQNELAVAPPPPSIAARSQVPQKSIDGVTPSNRNSDTQRTRQEEVSELKFEPKESETSRGLGRASGNPEDDIFELSPFVVEEEDSLNYQASSTLAGTRINTNLKDPVGTIQVFTQEFLEDTGATDAAALQYFRGSTEPKDAQGNLPNSTADTTTWSIIGKEPDQWNNKELVVDKLAIRTEALQNPEPSLRIQASYEAPQKPVVPRQEPWNREAYDRIVENAFKSPKDHALSTFSIDVDTASYANTRRYLNGGQLPPADAVRIEEMINYFSYNYDGPKNETPFALHVDAANAPWNSQHRLVRIGLQGKKVELSERPDANLVFLIDVSGSMSDQNKLPLVQRSLNLLVDQMEARDSIAVVVYAGASGLALPSTTANNKETIQHAISNLKSGGSTNGGAGIELAYSVAQKHFVKDGINRVILCTDGDFNVGTSDRGSLTRMIEEKAKTGVFFSVLGFGMGNYQDASMEELSNKGNGNYGYVDSFKEARKVFVDDMLGTLYAIAKDVKIQVEFNPAKVAQYRLIGYENRILAKEDFNDDTKDAGEIGADHTVTALYEIIPTGIKSKDTPSVDPLKYQKTAISERADDSAETFTIKLRYKQPDEDVSQLIEQVFVDSGSEIEAANDDYRFATAVASFGMLLRNSEFTENLTLKDVLDLASKAKGKDSGGLRSEFIELVEKAITLTPDKE
ncbi:MAG: VWA domain-containing protein [Verrucomicrobia bacterium]|nr:VWA domain-containing protein [Verrucomicrobiota bacterium]MDA1067753.1 VWA domain-containing protein [Verrucomicrobiota bacterium]